jgi:protein phosphatase 2C family protein 2/3
LAVSVFCFFLLAGAAASKFAGTAVYKRLINETAYRDARYADALKDAFLGADADLKSGM